MEDVLEVYQRQYADNEVLVCLSRVNYICRSCCLIQKCYRNSSTWGPPQPVLIPALQGVPPWAHQRRRRPAFGP